MSLSVSLVPPVADTSRDTPDSKKPRPVRQHRTGLELHTAKGKAMQEQGTQFYRVKAVAERYDVSPATIYRAIQAGELDAIKIGNTVRIPAHALRAFEETAAETAYQDAQSGDIVAALIDDATDTEGEVA
jgi:excisionase family DNA binding protein